MDTEITLIKIILNCGDKFNYKGTYTAKDWQQFLVNNTPHWIYCLDDKDNEHVFHSSEIAHIYTSKVVPCY